MLAVVIPYYKITFFEETLASLANQTSKEFNVYIGDDASAENPESIITAFKDKLNITYKRFGSNLGSISLSRHWKRCIELTKGEEWIMVLGDDDLISPLAVESFYEHYKNFNERSNVVRFSSQILFDETNTFSGVFEQPRWEKPEDSFMRRYQGQSRSSLSEYVFAKKAYDLHGFYDYPLAWHSDDRAWLEFSNNKPIYSINAAIVVFRHSTYNITGRKDNKEEKSIASEEFFRFLSQWQGFSKKYQLMFARIFERDLRKKGKIETKEWLILLKIYLSNFQLKPFKLFCKRWFEESILNKTPSL